MHTNLSRRRSFSKTFFISEKFENAEKHFENESFQLRTMISQVIYIASLNLLRCNVDGKHLKRFQSEISVFKFLRRSGRTSDLFMH